MMYIRLSALVLWRLLLSFGKAGQLPEDMHGAAEFLGCKVAGQRQSHRGLGDLLDDLLMLQAVPYELCNGDALQPMLLGELQELHEPGHAPVSLVHDLAEAA